MCIRDSNNRLDFILDEIFRRSPDILLFSTYIWNVDMVRRLASEYRKLRPDALIGAGGPEVSYESEAFLRQNPAFGLIIRGEGEQTVRQLLSAAESGADWHVLDVYKRQTEYRDLLVLRIFAGPNQKICDHSAKICCIFAFNQYFIAVFSAYFHNHIRGGEMCIRDRQYVVFLFKQFNRRALFCLVVLYIRPKSQNTTFLHPHYILRCV